MTGADPDIGVLGTVKDGVRERLAKILADSGRVIIVSAVCKYPRWYSFLYRWLVNERVDFSDVWAGDGLPYADVYVDDEAVKLTDL